MTIHTIKSTRRSFLAGAGLVIGFTLAPKVSRVFRLEALRRFRR